MCMESITYVKISVGAAGGIRPWVATKSPARLAPRRVRVLAASLLAPGVRS
jgi:hypothetical protein